MQVRLIVCGHITPAKNAERILQVSFPKIISGRIGDAAQPRSEWRQWRQNVGLLGARAHPAPSKQTFPGHKASRAASKVALSILEAPCARDDVVQQCKQRSWPNDALLGRGNNTFTNVQGADWSVLTLVRCQIFNMVESRFEDMLSRFGLFLPSERQREDADRTKK